MHDTLHSLPAAYELHSSCLGLTFPSCGGLCWLGWTLVIHRALSSSSGAAGDLLITRRRHSVSAVAPSTGTHSPCKYDSCQRVMHLHDCMHYKLIQSDLWYTCKYLLTYWREAPVCPYNVRTYYRAFPSLNPSPTTAILSLWLDWYGGREGGYSRSLRGL